MGLADVKAEALSVKVINTLSDELQKAQEVSDLARDDPERYGRVLCELAKGKTAWQVMRLEKVSLGFVSRVKVEAAVSIGKLRHAFAFDAAQFTMMAQAIGFEMMEQFVAGMQEWHEENPDKPYPVKIEDLNFLARLIESGSKVMTPEVLDNVDTQVGNDDDERIERAKELRERLQKESIDA